MLCNKHPRTSQRPLTLHRSCVGNPGGLAAGSVSRAPCWACSDGLAPCLAVAGCVPGYDRDSWAAWSHPPAAAWAVLHVMAGFQEERDRKPHCAVPLRSLPHVGLCPFGGRNKSHSQAQFRAWVRIPSFHGRNVNVLDCFP